MPQNHAIFDVPLHSLPHVKEVSNPEDIKITTFSHNDNDSALAAEIRGRGDIFAGKGQVRIEYDETLPPVLIGEFNLTGIVHHLYLESRHVVALNVVAKSMGIQLHDAKQMASFRERPDVQQKLVEISSDPFAMHKIHVTAWEHAKGEMNFITIKRFNMAIAYAIKNLCQLASEENLDELYASTNRPTRTADKRLSSVFSNAAKTARVLANAPKGRRKGSKNSGPRFKYGKLKKLVISLSKTDEHTQENVAKSMGYGGVRQFRQALAANIDILRQHGHTTHKWKQLTKEMIMQEV